MEQLSRARTMFSKTSSQRTSLGPNLSVRYLFFGKHSVPKSFSRPSGKSTYITGFFVSSWASEPCCANSGVRSATPLEDATPRSGRSASCAHDCVAPGTQPAAMWSGKAHGGKLTILPAATGAMCAPMLSRNLMHSAHCEGTQAFDISGVQKRKRMLPAEVRSKGEACLPLRPLLFLTTSLPSAFSRTA